MNMHYKSRRKRTKIPVEDGIKVVRKISWECSCAGKYYPKKILPLKISVIANRNVLTINGE